MLKRILLLFVLVFAFTFCANAQDRLVNKANAEYEDYSFTPAIDIYKKVIDRGYISADLLKRLGNSYYFNANYNEAAETYKRLVDDYASDVGPEYYFRYAQTLRTLGKYDRADAMMAKFTAETSDDRRAAVYEEEKEDYLTAIATNSGRYTMGPFEYNSKYAEFAPSFYNQGLIFSSDRDTGNLARYRHTWNSRDFLDLYKVNTDSSAINNVNKLDKRNINTRLHESTTAFTKDGNTLYFTRNNFQNGKVKKDQEGVIRLMIFRTTMVNGVWSTPEALPFNSDDYSVAHPALSPDEKTLFFASDMPGTVGLSDLFKVAINDDGSFGTPENLGKSINTEARETFPFVTKNEILYFSSEGHLGLGGLDVFATKIAEGKYTNSILNVGEPINSKQDDFTFIFNEDNKEGYFASNTGIRFQMNYWWEQPLK